MNVLAAFGKQTFSSFAIPNYRRYFVGQGLSHIGSWMQTVALGWLVIVLTGSGVALGSVLAVRFAPLLFGAIIAGNLVDSFDKRRLLIATQSAAAIISLTMGALIYAGVIAMWMVYVAALSKGLVDMLDRPARQTFVHEIVGPENLRNAVSLNSSMANTARALGPLFAGSIIATLGIAVCYLANALSFVAFIVALLSLRSGEMHREARDGRKVEHVFAGVRYVASMPLIRTILITMAVIGTLAYEFQVSLPLLAHTTFLGDAADYAALLSAMGVGSIAGGLFTASRKDVVKSEFIAWAFLFGVSVCIVALMPSLSLAVLAMVVVGFFSVAMSATGSTMIQLASEAHMRGRVMALWSMAIFGSTLIGAPIIGFIGEYGSPRTALMLGGGAAIIASLFAARRLLESYAVFPIPPFIKIRREEAAVENTRA